MSIHHPGVTTVPITSVEEQSAAPETDELSVEEPLQIDLSVPHEGRLCRRSLAVTMRTPGNDVELAVGFLFTEGIISDKDDIAEIRATGNNVVHATLDSTARVELAQFERHSFVSSSCGVCGKRSIAAVLAVKRYALQAGVPAIDPDVVHCLPRVQRAAQPVFHRTGGIHAAALFDPMGHLLSSYEDVGRHNALDKLIGAELLAGRVPLANRIALVSGRASFELIQKACVAGIPVLAAVGAPSSLAVTLARQTSMTLLGFVRDERFNVYADAGRLGTSQIGVSRTGLAEHSVLRTNRV